jgi:hypothetical protein
VFIGSGPEVEHFVEPVHLELVSYHLSVLGTGTGIANISLVGNALHCCDGPGDYALPGDACRDQRTRGEVPDDPRGI